MFDGTTTSARLPLASVVVSDIPDCQYSVSVTVSTTFGQVRV